MTKSEVDRQRSVITETLSPNNHKFSCRADGREEEEGGSIKHIQEQSGRRDKEATIICAIYRVSQEECARLGRVFLMLKYTDITQNTYI